MIDRGQQIPRAGGAVTRAADPLAIHGDQPTPDAARLGTSSRPGADGAVQLITIQTLQRPAHGRLRRRTSGTEGEKNLLRGIGGPLTDRGERPTSRHHRKRQDRTDLVSDTPRLTRIWYRVKHSQHATPDSLVVNSVDEVVNNRVDRRC
jgi:hypothetical protein